MPVTLRTRSGAARATAITNLLRQKHVARSDERKVVTLLRECPSEELADVILGVDLHALFGDVDNRFFGPDHATELHALFSRDRISDVTIEARAAIITALQTHNTTHSDERTIRDLMLATRGVELTALKNLIDAGGDHRDLHQLLHSDIDDKSLRAEILAHIANEKVPTGQVKILSDVDDTVYANWKDPRYPGKTVYPGVIQFYRELDRGAGDVEDRMGDLAFLTARPNDRPGVVENRTRKMLARQGVSDAVVLTGSITAVAGNRSIANKKLENFRQYAALFPEYGFVFIGDSGQGDVMLAEAMRAEPDLSVTGLFIHDVVDTNAETRAAHARKGIFFFDTYVGAAVEAHRLGLIHRQGLTRVAAAAQEALEGITFASPEQRAARRGELERDLAVVGKS